MMVTKQQLIEGPRDKCHVVLLGAGASRAAFGKNLPVMNDFVQTLKLRPLIDEAGLDVGNEKNFEVIYDQLVCDSRHENTARKIECRIREYFSGLALPVEATIYDRLLVSLRPTDAVFTFNWDPFLFDAYRRNYGAVPLPGIFFLHGNVRIGACRGCGKWGARSVICPNCSQMFVDVPLLYPIGKKDYSKVLYIQSVWESAKLFFREAFTLTIFGYGAPASDVAAVQLLRLAWVNEERPRTFEHIEIIDTATQSDLYDRWSPFTPTHHCHFTTAFKNSHIARWPRRSCESYFYPMTQGKPCEDFPLPPTDNLAELQRYAADIARHEVG